MEGDLDLFGGFDGDQIDDSAAMDLSANASTPASVPSAKKRKVGKQQEAVQKTEKQLVTDMVTKMGAGGPTVKYCTAFPPGESSTDLDPAIEKPFCGREPAKKYKFELDGFQVGDH